MSFFQDLVDVLFSDEDKLAVLIGIIVVSAVVLWATRTGRYK